MNPIARVAVATDIPNLVELSRQMVALLPVGKLAPFDVQSSLNTFSQMLMREDAIILTSGTGYLIGVLTPLTFNNAFVFAQEIGWFETAKGGKVLIEAYEDWAKSQGALACGVARIEGARDGALDRIYKSIGYVPIEHHYIKVF